MKRLPPAKKLAALAQATPRGSAAMAYLAKNRGKLKEFETTADFAYVLDERPELKGLEHHLIQARRAIIEQLWTRELLIGVSVIDDLLFHGLKDEQVADPLLHVFEFVRDHGLHKPGVMVFPAHSFGIRTAGMLAFFRGERVSLILKEFGLAVTPQTNGLSDTVEFLNAALSDFGISRELPLDIVHHWHRSRKLWWLSQNPLLIIKTNSFPGSYYENQPLLFAKLDFAASLLFMLAALEPPPEDGGVGRMGSSATLNNFETLDMEHYLVFYNPPNKSKMDGDCVPMLHIRSTALVEMTDLAVDIAPHQWKRRPRLAARLHDAVQRVQGGYFAHTLGRNREGMNARVYRKMTDSLAFFRRSFRRADRTEATTHLAAAFEVLLTDNFSRGVGDEVQRRVRLALKGVRGSRAMQKAVVDLYEVRSEFMHAGRSSKSVDLRAAQRTFVHAFLGVVERLDHLPATSSAPVGHLLGA